MKPFTKAAALAILVMLSPAALPDQQLQCSSSDDGSAPCLRSLLKLLIKSSVADRNYNQCASFVGGLISNNNTASTVIAALVSEIDENYNIPQNNISLLINALYYDNTGDVYGSSGFKNCLNLQQASNSNDTVQDG